jgi:membrane-bound lytic murein transglycosylase D
MAARLIAIRNASPSSGSAGMTRSGSAYRASLASAALFLLIGCGGAPPPAAAPEPEPEVETAPEPERPARPEIPIEDRVRAPFAVQSEGRTAPREQRRNLVVLDRAPAAPAAQTTPAAPAAAREAERGSAAPAGGASAPRPPATPAPPAPRDAAPAAGSGTQRTAAPREHTVAVGETFFGIAREYGVTPSALSAVNPGVDTERLRAGQVLRLPAYASRARTESPARPATQPARPPAAAAPAPARPAGQQRTHRVAAGETLWSIARRYGVTPEQVRSANRMTDDTVRIGQTLVIP